MIGRKIPWEFVFQALFIGPLIKKGTKVYCVSFQVPIIKEKWIMDSGCSKHMTGKINMLSSLQHKDGGLVPFGDNNQCKVIAIGNVGQGKNPLIENVLLVDGLRHNLLSISQFCDRGYKVLFDKDACYLYDLHIKNIIAMGKRERNIYVIDIHSVKNNTCLITTNDELHLWHKRLGHINIKTVSKLSKHELVRGIPKFTSKNIDLCEACQLGKQVKTSFKSLDMISTKRPLELLHMDLFGPSRIASINKNRYVFVIVDDYSRYTWVIFLKHKNEAYHEFTVFCKRVQNQKSTTIITIRSDHGGEFENDLFKTFCEENGITHNFAFPRASPQNGVVERKNRTLQETARTMLIDSKLPKIFWAEAVNTSCYILNRVFFLEQEKSFIRGLEPGLTRGLIPTPVKITKFIKLADNNPERRRGR